MTEPVIAITDAARERLVALRMQDPEADRIALWLAVAGVQEGRYVYEMTFRYLTDAGPEDSVQHHDDLSVIVAANSVKKLAGATLDVEAGNLTIDNPNRPSAVGMALPVVPKPAPGQPMPTGQPGGGHAGHDHGSHAGHDHGPAPSSPAVGAQVVGTLEGSVADRVRQVLEGSINPAIASHGGHAELAGIEGETAYLRLSGGCQGCGMAAVTLTQGIRQALLAAVPEIREVADVTDHAGGTNPYFAPSKS